MKALSADARRDLPLAVVAAATTWLTMLSWRGFSDLWGQYLGPLLLVAMIVPVAGTLLRAAPVPRRVGVLLHALIVVAVVWLLLGGSVLHPIGSARHIGEDLHDAWVSAQSYQPPIPHNVASIAPLLIPCGAAALWAVDVLACWLRRVPLAGLPLLAVYCVPISVIGSGVSWVVFLLAASGFLLMMFLHESAHITRWGRPLGGGSGADPQGFGVRNGASRTSATTVGSAAVVLAVVVPIFIPTLHLDGLGLFGPGGGGDGVKVVNPITDMRRDLHRGKDVPLLDVTTNDPDPTYMRIAVLTQFNGVEWTSGNREIVSGQTASGLVPAEIGLQAPTTPYNYRVSASNNFVSRWLPTMFPVTDVVAEGNWHYDRGTMDFISADDGTNTAGLTYTMTAAKPHLSAYSMENSLAAPLYIQAPSIALPDSLPSTVEKLAEQVTKGARSRYQEAVMLQRWFRDTGGFRYSLKSAPSGSSTQALLQFLNKGKGGRVGYCEQFASAFAVMARTLEIPTRVAIGFLRPQQVGKDRYVYSAHDMHAWPEVYFRGSGWVRFEPTPAARARSVPSYTVGPVRKPGNGAPTQNPGGRVTTDPASASASPAHDKFTTPTPKATSTPFPWLPLIGGLAVLVLLAALGLVPSVVRRTRRTRRLEGVAEDAWVELRDTAVDLGVVWPAGRSPHETGHLLAGWFGPDPDGAPMIRPPRGRGLAPGAEDALDRIVLTLERVRYARSAEDVPGALADDVRTCIEALEHGCTRGTLRRARWLPRSVIGGGRRAARAASYQREPEAVAAGGIVDHVG